MRLSRERLRLPLAGIALGSIAIAYCGLYTTTASASPVPLTLTELLGMSLPLTVAWFSFSGTCMLTEAHRGILGSFAGVSQFLGQATFIAGIPVWAYWYLDLVFGVI